MRRYLLRDIMETKNMSMQDVADHSAGFLTYAMVSNQLSGRAGMKITANHMNGWKLALGLSPEQIDRIFLVTM